jgi:hypothetical protein
LPDCNVPSAYLTICSDVGCRTFLGKIEQRCLPDSIPEFQLITQLRMDLQCLMDCRPLLGRKRTGEIERQHIFDFLNGHRSFP